MSKILKKLNYKKIVSVATAVCFTFSIFATSGFAAPVQTVATGLQTVNTSPAFNPSNFVVPFNIGRVTDSVNFNSDKVIVQIQDLHAHEETQRNIANILSLLDSKYKVNKVYVEGAFGDVDTSWLANISDDSLRIAIVNSLLSRGILTGAELYSVNSGKTNILKGIEDKKVYLDNFDRLVKIDSQRDDIKSLFPEIRMILSYLANQHYGKENKQIERVVNKYKNGNLAFDKYFSFLVRKANKQNVYFGFYPSIGLLSDIIVVQNRLNKNRVNSQIGAFLNELKSDITYAEYRELLEYSSTPGSEGLFYFKLADFYNKENYGGKYPELAKFLHFISLNQAINPLDLVSEERALLWEVRNNAAKTNKERELLYLGNFINLMEGFLENKITAPEYAYFERELPKFKALWTKYTRMSELPGLEQYYSLFENFYKANVERNNIFVKEMKGKLPKTNEANIAFSKDMVMTDVAELLANAKEIEVVVTGGFHTQDVSRILQNSRQSYVVITPNVTQDAATADKLFTENVLRISKYIPSNAFQAVLVSENFKIADTPANTINVLMETVFTKSVLESAAVRDEKGNILSIDANTINDVIRAGAEILKDKGIENLSISQPEAKEDGSYEIPVSYNNTKTQIFEYEIPVRSDIAKTELYNVVKVKYKVTENEVYEITDQTQAYNVKTAKIYGYFSAVFGGAVALFAAVVVFSVFPVTMMLVPAFSSMFIAGASILGILVPSMKSIENAKVVEEVLFKAKAEKEKGISDVVKNQMQIFLDTLNDFYGQELDSVKIVNDDTLPDNVIAEAYKSDGIIRVNGLALMRLAEDEYDLVEDIIIRHELTHIKPKFSLFRTEFWANAKTIFSPNNMIVNWVAYSGNNFPKVFLNFTKAVDNYKAAKELYKPEAVSNVIDAIREVRKHAEAPQYTQAIKDVLNELANDSAGKLIKDKDKLEQYKNLLKEFNISESNPVEIAVAKEYSDGKITTTAIAEKILPTKKDDILYIRELPEQEQLRLLRRGILEMLKGKTYITMLAAGASSRMSTAQAPEEVKGMVKGKTILSKAAVPVGEVKGDAVTYFDAYYENVSKLFTAINEAAKRAGIEGDARKNLVGYLTNEQYSEEQMGMLKDNNFYGIPRESVRNFLQPLGAKFIGTAEEVRKKMPAKFDNAQEADAYYARLAYSADTRQMVVSGNESAAILQGERDPWGHGEFLHQTVISGELLYMLETGIENVYIKNVDNYASKFDAAWLMTLGLFAERREKDQSIGFQAELSKRVPGIAGGSWVYSPERDSYFSAEDPTLKATAEAAKKDSGKYSNIPLTGEGSSYAFNNGAAFASAEYIAELYMKKGQTLENFILELNAAKGNQDTLEEIAQRGRAKFPKLIDGKPAKQKVKVTITRELIDRIKDSLSKEELEQLENRIGQTIETYPIAVKVETNLWQSTGVSGKRVVTVGVDGARNIDIEEYLQLPWEEKTKMLSWMRFMATKAWDKSESDKEDLRVKYNESLSLKEGDEGYVTDVNDPRLAVGFETYEGNKVLSDDLLRYIFEAELLDVNILAGSDSREDVVVKGKSLFGRVADPAKAFMNAMMNIFTKDKKEAQLIERMNAQLASLRKEGLTAESVKNIVEKFFKESGLTQAERDEMLANALNKIKFGTAGYRQQFGPMFNYVHILIVAQALAVSAKAEHGNKAGAPRVFIGYDTRYMSKEFGEIFAGVLAANGVEVHLSDRDVPTPGLSYILKNNPVYTYSVNITASHNPYDYNGIKVTNSTGGQASSEVTKSIEGEIQKIVSGEVNINYKTLAQGETDGTISILSDKDVKDKYIKGFMEMFKRQFNITTDEEFETFKKEKASKAYFVVDAKNGTTPDYYETLFKELGITNYKIINADFDPTFQGEDPNPDRNVDALKKEVESIQKANKGMLVFGLSTDPDGDRMAVIEGRNHFTTDSVILYSAYKLLQQGIEKSNAAGKKQTVTFIVNRPTSVSMEALKEYAEKNNLNVNVEIVRTPVGFKWIAEEIQKAEEKAAKNGLAPMIMGAEESGAVVVGGLTYDKDGLVATLYTSLLTLNDGKSIDETLKEITSDAVLGWNPVKTLTNIKLGELSQLDVVKESLKNVLKDNNARESFINSFSSIMEKYGLEITSIKDVNEINGVKVDDKDAFEGIRIETNDPNTWVVLRLSGTEPIVKAYVETNDEKKTDELANLSKSVIENIALGTQTQETKLSGIQSFINDIIITIAKLLGINLKDTYITKNYPELIRLDDVINLSRSSEEQSLYDNLIEKAGRGKNVHAIMPMDKSVNINDIIGSISEKFKAYDDGNLNVTTDIHQTGLRHIQSISITNNSGFSINLYYYTDGATRIQPSYDALSYLINDVLEGSVGIIENDLDSAVSYENLLVLSPEATVYARTKNEAENNLAKTKSYSNVTNGISEQSKIAKLSEERKIKRNLNDMRNQPRTFTIADVSRISDKNILKKIEKVGSNTAIVSLNYSDYKGKIEDIRKFIAEAHKMEIDVILEFKASAGETEQMLADLVNENSLKSLRDRAGRGVDGVVFDFGEETAAAMKAPLISKMLSVVKSENSEGLLAVKTSDYNDNFKKDGFTDFNGKWKELVKTEGEYNKKTLDTSELAKSAAEEVEKGAEAIGFNLEVIELLETAGINFNFTALIMGIISKWTAVLRQTPEGRYREGKRVGLNEKVSISAENENHLYRLLNEMRTKETYNNEDLRHLLEDLQKLSGTDKTKSFINDFLAKFAKSEGKFSNDEKELLVSEVRGYLQGMLEKMQSDIYSKGLKFNIKTDADIYRSALVEAKMYIVLNGIEPSKAKNNIPYGNELFSKGDTYKTPYDMKLLDVEKMVFEKQTAPTNGELREAINILTWSIESGNISNDNKPIALAKLLDLLAMYNREVGKIEKAAATDQRSGVQAILASA
ncbi:MAG: hypothetical protein FWF00_04165 [Endomicrobia bacterium]|nr:hypothetical protein [Endomicrobiia bacterium]MCL2506865.1 hypothetical protein [Endomicrobiia bacterium]